VLKSRREQIEFLNLEGKELLAQRELDRLRSETAEGSRLGDPEPCPK